ncbi:MULTISPECIES: carbon-nitrogen hydrolase family protein [Streptomyces phaeochromogenes group]|uniref:carbon-nitrogen hydrolase family protein n=1 Tax=Streptomyces phaeochromogenes group TaxID=2838332 RepID=UPI0033C0A395|nr:carbon-nitrogen hydrolase family protein [Streptomyces phaeochromogenes]
MPLLASARISDPDPHTTLTVAAAQLGGPWLNVSARMSRLVQAAELAAAQGAQLLGTPETYLSGYPFWLARTHGARFNDADQKACYAAYLDSAIEVSGPELRELEQLAADLSLTLTVGVTERGRGNASGSTFCTLLTVHPKEGLVGHHRKLVPTYDERLVWAQGDGAGLRTHQVGHASVGSLNCWENWMPQARHALYADGEQVHVSSWPGSSRLTGDITRFTAQEGRVFAMAVSGILRPDDVPADFPLAEEIRANSEAMPFDGGSAIAAPDGSWVVPPAVGAEGLIVADLDLGLIDRERLTFDPTGHYSRPDIFTVTVDRRRRQAGEFIDQASPAVLRDPAAGTEHKNRR